MQLPAGVPAASRFDRLDALRGVTIMWMALFHFSFDLNHFGLMQQDFHDGPLWTGQCTCIASLLLFLRRTRSGGGLSARPGLAAPLARATSVSAFSTASP